MPRPSLKFSAQRAKLLGPNRADPRPGRRGHHCLTGRRRPRLTGPEQTDAEDVHLGDVDQPGEQPHRAQLRGQRLTLDGHSANRRTAWRPSRWVTPHPTTSPASTTAGASARSSRGRCRRLQTRLSDQSRGLPLLAIADRPAPVRHVLCSDGSLSRHRRPCVAPGPEIPLRRRMSLRALGRSPRRTTDALPSGWHEVGQCPRRGR